MTFTELVKNYKETSAADKYWIGFTFAGMVYSLILKELPDWMFKKSRESTAKGGWLKAQMKLNREDKEKLLGMGAQMIGTLEILNGLKNKGEAWEKYLTEQAGQEWHKDSIPYFVDGDLTVNGIKYQIKFEGASFANEKTIGQAMARA